MSHRERERDDHSRPREPEYDDRERRPRRDERDGRSDERRRGGDDRRRERERDSARDGRRERDGERVRDAERGTPREREDGKRRGHDADVREGKTRSRSRSPSRRDRDRETDRDRPRRRSRSRSASTSSRSSHSSSSSESDSGSDEERDRRRRKRDKKEKRRKEEKRAKKDRKREKKEKKRLKKTSAVTSQWGTYGIIDVSDQHNKEPEFRAWLVEERHVNPETLAKDKERKEFARFVEDYNTATLPHEKYYDMEKYEIKMRLIRGGEAVPDMPGSSTYDPNADMAAHSNSLKRAPVETDSFLNKSQVAELRRLQQERSEVGQRKVLGLAVPKAMGVRQEERNKLYR